MNKVTKYFFVGLFVFLLLLEIGLRFVLHEQLKTRHFPLIYQPNEEFSYVYTPNKNEYLCVPSIEKKIKINKWGLNGKEFPLVKSKGIFRIIVIGDSNESGLWLNSDNNYINLLQQKFSERKINVEVLNFARDGTWKVLSNINFLKEFAVKFSPDLIIFNTPIPFLLKDHVRECYKGFVIEYNPNRKISRHDALSTVDKIHQNRIFTTLYDLSFMVRAICKKIIDSEKIDKNRGIAKYIQAYVTKRYLAEDLITYEYTNSKSVELIDKLKMVLIRKNCHLIILNYTNNQLLSKLLRDKSIGLIQLGLKFNKSHVHKFDDHSNEEGHKLISDALFTQLNRKMYIPSKFKMAK